MQIRKWRRQIVGERLHEGPRTHEIAGTPAGQDFSRLDLANAIASPPNPLTARVIVNRVWSWHFGRGLVATPSNFGFTGAKPTHPELLDYLTRQLIANGGYLKPLHKLLLTSAAYRQTSNANAAGTEQDADALGA